MSKRVFISAAEHARLIRATEASRTSIATAFGPSGVWLAQNADGSVQSAWALPLLANWRGETQAEGAGI